MISGAELEWANYAAMAESARVTPGPEVVLREDVILAGSEMLPVPDANHACLLRAAAPTVDSLLDEVTAYFRDRQIAVTVFTSPNCTPNDLEERLTGRGFARQEGEEVWLVLEDLPHCIGILGSAGVLPEHRRGGGATNLAIQAALDGRREGVETLVLQTAGGTFLERVLLANGFRRAFARRCYVLP